VSFTDFLSNPQLAERYRKVRQYFYLKESAYDVTSACQLRCDGCYYFEGEKSHVKDNRDPAAWRAFFEEEKARGITYVVLAGAEPSLVPKIIAACHDVIPLGSVATNGLKPIDRAIRYRIHLSVWGDSSGDPNYRKRVGGKPGPDCLAAQLKNYRNDDRAIFVYTFNAQNIDQVDDVAKRLADENHKLTFNVFSTPSNMNTWLDMKSALDRTRGKMIEMMERFPGTVLYSYYNAQVHTHALSLHDLFGCVYPRAQRMNSQVVGGLGNTFRSYRTDLTHKVESDCCVPDTDCSMCRHYAAGSAIVTSNLHSHAATEMGFRAWLDYVDTYLSVWVMGYRKGQNLFPDSGERVLQLPEQRPRAAATALRVL